MQTPWGVSQDEKVFAEGIVSVSTAGHGGFCVSPEKQKEMPKIFRRGKWYEEDCEWCFVVLSFPEHFEEEVWKQALSTLMDWYPDLYMEYKRKEKEEEDDRKRRV